VSFEISSYHPFTFSLLILLYVRGVEPNRIYAVETLIRDLHASDKAPGWGALLSTAVDVASRNGADSRATLTALEDSLVYVIDLLPPKKRLAAATGVMRLLLNRIRSNGLG